MRVRAYAKINLALDILKKAKNGYHRIATLLQEVDLFDELVFKKLSTAKKIILHCDDPKVPKDSRNTVFKAAQILQKKYPEKTTGIEITILKNIPVKAGLGGGSSDGAATLKALVEMWKLKISKKTLQKLAADIGMDTPFFINGGTAYGTHFGEKIQQLPPVKLPPALFILLPKAKKKSTNDSYKNIEKYPHGERKIQTVQLVKAIKENRKILEFFHNDFDILYEAKMEELKKKLKNTSLIDLHCAGSGPGFYALFATEKDLLRAQKKLEKFSQTWIIAS